MIVGTLFTYLLSHYSSISNVSSCKKPTGRNIDISLVYGW